MLQSDRSRRLAFLAQDPRPDIASVSGYCHQWHKTLTDVTRSKHVRPQQLRKKKEHKERHLPALPATGKKKIWRRLGKKHFRCGGPTHQQKDVFARPTKLCTIKWVPREAVQTQGRARVCQFTFAVALQMRLKLLPTCSHDASSNGLCVALDTSSHDIWSSLRKRKHVSAWTRRRPGFADELRPTAKRKRVGVHVTITRHWLQATSVQCSFDAQHRFVCSSPLG